MNKYIFPGADASTPLGWFVDSLEAAGFEVKSIDTIGVHYSATLWRWYRNWMSNKADITAKYGERYSSLKLKLSRAQMVQNLGVFPSLFHDCVSPRWRCLLSNSSSQGGPCR